jgi:meso-butanediol dehydrogenase/(S,S)-butanediol dehydrogenase/diacetyl reductase
MELEDKAALITGAGSGIGRATALLFAARGARISVVDSNAHTGAKTAELIMAEGGSALFTQADVSKGGPACIMVDAAVEAWGRLDIVVNSAGIGVAGNVETLDEETWDRAMDVNLKSVFLSSKYAVPHMRKQGEGSILIIASANAVRPYANRDAYSASKGALIALTKGMALSFAKDQIRVNCLCPGTTDTPMLDDVINQLPENERPERQSLVNRQPLGRMGTPEEIAEAAMYAVTARFMTGTILLIDGGMTL